jgi:hypothetical protein
MFAGKNLNPSSMRKKKDLKTRLTKISQLEGGEME